MPVYNAQAAWLKNAIESVIASTYRYWELCIVDDASTDPAVRNVLEAYLESDQRVRVCFSQTNGHISRASNSALEMASGEWITLMDHDDILAPNALEQIHKAVQANPELRLIYSDEDKIDDNTQRFDPYYKPNWNRDLFYSHNMISHLGAYHRETVQKIGGFRRGLEGSQDYDLALRVTEQIQEDQIHHIPKILYHWRSHSGSTASAGAAKPYAVTAGEKAINDHLQRVGSRGSCSHDGEGGYRVRYPLPEKMVGITGFILSDGKKHALGKCVRQLEKLSEIVNVIVLPTSCAAGRRISGLNFGKHISVLDYMDGQSLSSLLNGAVDSSQGDFLFFLPECLDGVNQESLKELISHAARSDIGAVGGMVLYPDGRVRQAGRLLDPYRISCPSFHHYHGNSRGYMGRLTLIQNYSAVSKNGMVIEKKKFLEIGGFDEEHLRSYHLDVDLCLRLKEAGYRTLWTPYARFTDSRPRFSISDIRGRFSSDYCKDCEWMQNRWGSLLKNDPAYNPNLNQKKKDFNFKWPPKENE